MPHIRFLIHPFHTGIFILLRRKFTTISFLEPLADELSAFRRHQCHRIESGNADFFRRHAEQIGKFLADKFVFPIENHINSLIHVFYIREVSAYSFAEIPLCLLGRFPFKLLKLGDPCL
ncbi:MAG: hypothetical protein D4R93_02320 [Deltaproteobacteria bacterium]|nr:MAG: hypothetical protein D4R93_02320 [Deltaproteobacteria bacterium]